MRIAVQTKGVAFINDTSNQCWVTANVFTDDKEGRAMAVLREQIQYRRRAFGMWPIIKRQRDSGASCASCAKCR
jgi:hypothetical protein